MLAQIIEPMESIQMYQMFCKCNPCSNNRSTIEKHKCASINARFISVDIPIKFPSGLHDTRLTDIDESLTKAPCKGLLISNIQPLFASNSSSTGRKYHDQKPQLKQFDLKILISLEKHTLILQNSSSSSTEVYRGGRQTHKNKKNQFPQNLSEQSMKREDAGNST